MKPITAAAPTGLGLALAGCTYGERPASVPDLNFGNIPTDYRLNLRAELLAIYNAECTAGRHAFIADTIAANRVAAAAALAIQAVGAAQLIQDWSSTSPSSDLEQGQ